MTRRASGISVDPRPQRGDSAGEDLALSVRLAETVLTSVEAPLAADPSTGHLFLVVSLVLMGVALLLAGYYAGQARK